MLDIRHIEKNSTHVVHGLLKRGEQDAHAHVQELIHQNSARKSAQKELDELLAQVKKYTEAIAGLIALGQHLQVPAYQEKVRGLKPRVKQLTEAFKKKDQALKEALLALPNLPHEKVPEGKGYEDNTVLNSWKTSRPIATQLQPHWELVDRYRLVNFAEASQIAGSGFALYHDQGARLERALANFFVDEAVASGYKEVAPPLIVNRASALGTGQLPDKEGMMYRLQEKEEFYLIPTAEVPVTNIYRKKRLTYEQLPIKHVAYTPCFRREAGSWGLENRGLKRLHQFNKVELVTITTMQGAMEQVQQMLSHVCGLLEKLDMTYRVLTLCGGELSFASALTYDVEVWAEAQQEWLEVSSISYFGSFQSMRMDLKYEQKGKKAFCATINGSGLALPRVMAALLESFQQKDTIPMPQVLHQYLGFEAIRMP